MIAIAKIRSIQPTPFIRTLCTKTNFEQSRQRLKKANDRLQERIAENNFRPARSRLSPALIYQEIFTEETDCDNFSNDPSFASETIMLQPKDKVLTDEECHEMNKRKASGALNIVNNQISNPTVRRAVLSRVLANSSLIVDDLLKRQTFKLFFSYANFLCRRGLLTLKSIDTISKGLQMFYILNNCSTEVDDGETSVEINKLLQFIQSDNRRDQPFLEDSKQNLSNLRSQASIWLSTSSEKYLADGSNISNLSQVVRALTECNIGEVRRVIGGVEDDLFTEYAANVFDQIICREEICLDQRRDIFRIFLHEWIRRGCKAKQEMPIFQRINVTSSRGECRTQIIDVWANSVVCQHCESRLESPQPLNRRELIDLDKALRTLITDDRSSLDTMFLRTNPREFDGFNRWLSRIREPLDLVLDGLNFAYSFNVKSLDGRMFNRTNKLLKYVDQPAFSKAFNIVALIARNKLDGHNRIMSGLANRGWKIFSPAATSEDDLFVLLTALHNAPERCYIMSRDLYRDFKDALSIYGAKIEAQNLQRLVDTRRLTIPTSQKARNFIHYPRLHAIKSQVTRHGSRYHAHVPIQAASHLETLTSLPTKFYCIEIDGEFYERVKSS